jgi:enoyl-CoA hydratase/carnithine racemase
MDNDTLKLLGAGGGFTVLLGAFVWLIRTVGLALVAKLGELGAKIDAHTAKDIEHHSEVKEAVIRLEARFDAATRPIAREGALYQAAAAIPPKSEVTK